MNQVLKQSHESGQQWQRMRVDTFMVDLHLHSVSCGILSASKLFQKVASKPYTLF